ncbi:uncharacterized protein LOC110037259 [Phalaenopsis equestris]|uniref:uncharacterized protein LOC110037259 n=1 Tax=Phalaenopsis equestris TaxID=78828 RepID=UPI0009E3A658|nr:uncharacterized protein LOC110037259 [Phalaenopsis equestris]
MDSCWLVGGDFNCIAQSVEKIGGRSPNLAKMNLFFDDITQVVLFDIGFNGTEFTWKRGEICERLDRILVNDLWCQYFLYTFVTHLSLVGSDHIPLLISITASELYNSPPPFRYLNMWSDHPSILNTVAEAWHTTLRLDLWSKLVYLPVKVSKALKAWGCSCFAKVFKAVDVAEKEDLELKNFCLVDGGEDNLLLDAQEKLLIVIDRQEKLLMQKASIKHLKDGDRNTTFYHACIKYRRQCNTIHTIQNSEGTYRFNNASIALDAVTHF